ncbi:MAG: hypothetical protein CMM16_03820 [Rhodospirillaceae bacterium]|nr:hypothetical protein [Rhodospirillaceae bacterium]
MALKIDTFDNRSGGSSYYKAISHPLAAEAATSLLSTLRDADGVAIYDPLGYSEGFAAFYPLDGINLRGVFVQDIEKIGDTVLGHQTQPVTDMPGFAIGALLDVVFVMAFDADKLIDQVRHLLPTGTEVASLDALRLPDAMLSNDKTYLNPMNFATNFAFFRDTAEHHTRIVTANYWARYGAKKVSLWLRLVDNAGGVLAEWTEDISGAARTVEIDSQEVRDRFSLDDFTGQLFIHAIGATGHDVIKYALDIYGADGHALSCTHDANAWPADLYGGLPAPRIGEDVILWVQNSHPCTIPAGEISLNLMGKEAIATVDSAVGPYATLAIRVNEALPHASWPQQIELSAGKHFVRPRYEVTTAVNDRRMAHMNVERVDLKIDPCIPELSNLMGKGYILPAPVLPTDIWNSVALPTPMSTAQITLPVALLAIDSEGREAGRVTLGNLPRDHACQVVLKTEMADALSAMDGFGHMELVYDFADGGEADGWLHSLFRYENVATGNAAETSFGAHIFNTVLTYKTEPQSYTSHPPGLTTRLFLRLGKAPLETMCHLIYPASSRWHATSETDIGLHDRTGAEVATARLEIPCGGSRFWRYSEMFDNPTRAKAGDGAHIIIRDTTCRLFGYHGLIHTDGGFSLDHMFGF